MFNAALEGTFRRLDWDRKGININGDHRSHLCFAVDIVLTTNNAELEEMLNDLNKKSNNIGLRINMKKSKVMFNSYAKVKQIKVNDDVIETTDRQGSKLRNLTHSPGGLVALICYSSP